MIFFFWFCFLKEDDAGNSETFSVHRCREYGLLGGGRTAADSAGNFPPNRNLRRNLKDAPSIRSRHVCVRSDLEGHTAHTKRKQHAEMRKIETLAHDLLDVLPHPPPSPSSADASLVHLGRSLIRSPAAIPATRNRLISGARSPQLLARLNNFFRPVAAAQKKEKEDPTDRLPKTAAKEINFPLLFPPSILCHFYLIRCVPCRCPGRFTHFLGLKCAT